MSSAKTTYMVHDAKNVKGFFGEYHWLSNFHICPIMYDRLFYQSVENAYQAAKVKPECRADFIDVSPAVAKKMWKNYPLVDTNSLEWDRRKFTLMCGLVFEKFHRNSDLLDKLLETKGMYLEESNDWGDRFWGYDVRAKRGKNMLGKILTSTREYWERLYERYSYPCDTDFAFDLGLSSQPQPTSSMFVTARHHNMIP